jgi:hypothetical protein
MEKWVKEAFLWSTRINQQFSIRNQSSVGVGRRGFYLDKTDNLNSAPSHPNRPKQSEKKILDSSSGAPESTFEDAQKEIEQERTNNADQQHGGKWEVDFEVFAFVVNIARQMAQPGEHFAHRQNQEARKSQPQTNQQQNTAKFNHPLLPRLLLAG